MPTIAQVSDFVDELEIPHTDEAKTMAKVQRFIVKYEPEVLQQVLGATLRDELYAGLQLEPVPDKWFELAGQVTPVILGYVYYWFLRNANTVTTSVSEVKGKAQNAIVVNSVDKMVSGWNSATNAAFKTAAFVAGNSETYGNYYLSLYSFPYGGWHNRCRPEIFQRMNALGI